MKFSPSLKRGGAFFLFAFFSVYHVKHLHLIEFQMLSGIVMKPSFHCYGNLGFLCVWGGYMVSPKKISP